MAQSPNNRFSIDGFTPNTPNRHVGFNPARRPAVSSDMQRVRMRRPGLHAEPAPRPLQGMGAGRMAKTDNLASQNPLQQSQLGTSRQNYSRADNGFTSYSNADSGQRLEQLKGGSGRRRQRGGKDASTAKPQKRGLFGRIKSWRWKKIIKRTAIACALLLLVCGGWVGWKVFNNSSKIFGDGNLIGFLNSSTLKGEDKGRVNMLLAGVSSDDPGHEGGELTDSIMLISLDTKNHKAFTLSIPRDLWVNIDGNGHSKINAANVYGEQDKFSEDGYPAGGMGLLEKTVSESLEMPIHYYAKINYTAFRDMVNAVGGISVNVQSEDPRGYYDPNINIADGGPLKLPNGVQTLNGQTALNFARARGDPTNDGRVAYGYAKSDFTRTQNQRLMLLALKDKLSSGSVITSPVKIGQLFDAVGKNVQTDLKPSEIRRMYDLGKQVQSKDIDSISLNDAGGVNLLANYRAPNGSSALIPAAGVDDYSDIILYLKKTMTSDPVAKEAAKIVVLNGGDTTGLATEEKAYLAEKGMSVVAIGDAPAQAKTTIIDQSKGAKPATKAKLQSIFGNTTGTADTGYPTADFVVILGASQQEPPSSSNNSSNN